MNSFIRLSIYALLLGLCSSGAVASLDDYRPVADYRIDVKLHDDRRRISGSVAAVFTNLTAYSTDTLWMNLYPNAFSSAETFFFRDNYRAAMTAASKDNFGRIEIDSLHVNGRAAAYHFGPDVTVISIPLDHTISPGDSVLVEMDFEVQLPEVIDRMGYSRFGYVLTQWYPKLGVLSDDGWICRPYRDHTEFFADFGTYDVRIDVPAEFTVAATGEEVSVEEGGSGRRVYQFRAERVHDFGWCAGTDLVPFSRRVGSTELELLVRPDHVSKADRFLRAAEAAVAFCDSVIGPSPYQKLSIVESYLPEGRGLELPGLVVISGDFLPFGLSNAEEAVVVHEIVHQWFYAAVASDPGTEAWLDEGLTTYVSGRITRSMFGDRADYASILGLGFSSLDLARLGYITDPSRDPVVQPSWEYYDARSYFANAYFKAQLMLETLENLVGRDVMDAALAEYYRRYAFSHPKTRDFTDTVSRLATADLDWFFQTYLYDVSFCDYRVERVENRIDPRDSTRYVSTVDVINSGEAGFPVELLVYFEDGREVTELLDGGRRHYRFEYSGESKAEAAWLDPEFNNLMDLNYNNNSLCRTSMATEVFKIQTNAFYYLQLIVDLVSAF